MCGERQRRNNMNTKLISLFLRERFGLAQKWLTNIFKFYSEFVYLRLRCDIPHQFHVQTQIVAIVFDSYHKRFKNRKVRKWRFPFFRIAEIVRHVSFQPHREFISRANTSPSPSPSSGPPLFNFHFHFHVIRVHSFHWWWWRWW